MRDHPRQHGSDHIRKLERAVERLAFNCQELIAGIEGELGEDGVRDQCAIAESDVAKALNMIEERLLANEPQDDSAGFWTSRN